MAYPFALIRKLGDGSFGDVWLANRGGQLVAVKFLRHPTREHIQRLAREAQILWHELANEYVVNLIDHDLGASPPYFVMEYCEGGSLRLWMQQHRTWREAVSVLSQALNGVAGILQAGGFHRDIKPENILLSKLRDATYRIKVADFGLARFPLPATSMTLSACGTPGYMAPEIVRGGAFHAGADIFSLGTVGIEIVTGDRNVLSLNTAPVPDPFKDLLRRMVSPFASSRPTVKQVAADLVNLASLHAPVPAAPVAPKPTTSPLWGLLGGAAAAGTVVGVLSWLAGGNKSRWDSEVGRYRGPDGKFRSR